MNALLELLCANKQGQSKGIYAVCSAHPMVLRAAIQQAKADQSLLLIEATANQVNQDGGYTGMQPADFIAFVHNMAAGQGLAASQLCFGGDHLGPVCWTALPALEAMAKAETLIAAFVRAGFHKIHLDTSMPCADDPKPLPDAVIAARAARLCQVAEQTAASLSAPAALCYVIGTEVPAPGGVSSLEQHLQPTPVANVADTIAVHQQAFAALGLSDDVWQKVIAVVVQPGVEFDNTQVHAFDAVASKQLADFIAKDPQLVFEAHSTDYQPQSRYQQLVQQHFAILKVGPQLTFALREALFALCYIEQQLVPVEAQSHLITVCERVMQLQPGHWQKFYPGNVLEQQLLRQYSYSDRIRYYWQQPALQQAVSRLIDNLSQSQIPLPLLSQFMPQQYQAVLNGLLTAEPQALVQHHIRLVLQMYASACGLAHPLSSSVQAA
ncbi:MAG: D-tagatose-bisphosphate aldolase, class II, non-catalytic subunit [Rheinheimera sp.]|nr:MAG: D-tagatose-bisphosphate aldolase, class II, non-catalytic subunit [Rheinheimera sp.]